MTQVSSDDQVVAPAGEQSLVDRQGDVAADYLEGLLDIPDLDGDIEIDVEPSRALVSVVETNHGELQHLVGQDGEVLDALQDLTRLAVTTQTGARSQHPAGRGRAPVAQAGRRPADRPGGHRGGARTTGRPVRLAAMSRVRAQGCARCGRGGGSHERVRGDRTAALRRHHALAPRWATFHVKHS